MGYQSEAQLEKNLLTQLTKIGYNTATIPDYETLLSNFHEQLNIFNEHKLNGQPITQVEFKRILTLIEGKSIYDSAKILRDKLLIEREDGTQLYVELMNTKDWCKNIFQVTTQTTVKGTYTNRYDVTILINGLPLVQIELKRRGLDFKEAFNQIQRYRRHTFNGLYRFLQIFVVSNGMDTKYFSNSDHDIQFGFTFTTFLSRETIDKYSYAATLEEIKDNDYNLNIPRYVDTFEEEEQIDLQAVSQRLKEIDDEIAEVDTELEKYFKELGV